MKIIRVFNNNAVVASDPFLGDVVLLGSGIGFQKKPNDCLDDNKIEKKYVFEDSSQKRFQESLSQISTEYYDITMQIVERAEEELETEFNSEIFISISDHIAFAVRRQKENVYLPNVILNETKILYRKEYEIGLWANTLIKKNLGIQLEEDEAGYIALHIINYSLNKKSNNASKVISFTKDIFTVIELTMKVTLDKESLAYARLSTHLKYLAERMFRNEVENSDTTLLIRKLLEKDEALSICINRIKKVIREKYDYDLSPDEETYLNIHIKNNVHLNTKKKLKSFRLKK